MSEPDHDHEHSHQNNENQQTQPDSSDVNPGDEVGEPAHDNPIDAADVTDAERAAMLHEYLEAFADEFGDIPKLMPLDDEGKAPIIKDRCSLDSTRGRSQLVDGEEGVRRIREDGARGFALYAGKPDHGTEDAVFVDHDNLDAFPTPTGEPTLEVMSGSGRGSHETYRNTGDVQNARVGDNLGEIRAKNWYVVVPGSIHPSGGVYHVVEDREIATLADEDLDDTMRPASRATGGSATTTTKTSATDTSGLSPKPTPSYMPADDPPSPESVVDAEPWIGDYLASGADDRSTKDYAVCVAMAECGIPEGDVRVFLNQSSQTKVSERGVKYWKMTWGKAVCEADVNSKTPDDLPDANPVAVLPPGVRHLTNTRAQDDDTPTMDDARKRTCAAITDAYESSDRVLTDALPTTGKSYGAIKAAAMTGEPITVLTGRGREEQYEQFQKWCAENGLDAYPLPSFWEECPTACGEHGDEIAKTVRAWYRAGATPSQIHALAESVIGESLPCQHGGHCPWSSKWDFDPDDYDVLLGHYKHGYNPKITMGRTVVVDEFPGGAFETTLGDRLQPAVSAWLAEHDAVPYTDYTDLIEHREDDARRADALAYLLEEHGLAPDEAHVIGEHDAEQRHAAAPLAVATILAAVDGDVGAQLDNGWERAALGDDRIGAHDREHGRVHLLQPPNLDYAAGVVALDGTPTLDMWELALGEPLNHTQVLTDAEREEYLTDCLGLNVVRTTEAIKPYNNSDHVAVDRDAALLEAVADEHGTDPALITSRTALEEYDAAGVLDVDLDDSTVTDGPASAAKWFGNVLGSNEYASERVGAVIGSNHYGDRYVKKWGAYAGEPVERGTGKGTDLSYGDFGDRILRHMREHDTLQAAMRFGRDGNGATVYVHTNTLPDWVPLAGEGRVVDTPSDGERQVLAALKDFDDLDDPPRTAEVAAHPDVEIGQRQVLNILEDFRDRGVLARQQDAADGRGVVWIDDGLHRVDESGQVELPPADLNDLDDDNVDEIVRTTTYTRNFVNFPNGPTPSPPRASCAGEHRKVQTTLAAFGEPPGG